MTPQSSFMVMAPLARAQVPAIRQLLSTMNSQPGVADPGNPLVPFERFENLHFARFVVLDDPTIGDIRLYGIQRPEPPVYLAFLGDFDGAYDPFVNDLAAQAGAGLRRIFSFCEGFNADNDLSAWFRAHEHPPATYYCNWIGRTMRQAREEEQLRRALSEYIRGSSHLQSASEREVHTRLREFVTAEQSAGRITLTPPAPTPLGWSLRHTFEILMLLFVIVGGALTLIVTWPILLLLWLKLRANEKADPEFAPRPDAAWVARLAEIEDFGLTNQFSAMGSLKPGLFRRLLLTVILWLVDLTTRVYYTKGRLARVHTIHFARWVFLDNKTRLLFASNYDGSLDSYMDDFINKVAFGLNAAFSNGIGYPRTDSLVRKGAKNEQLFKYFIRRHELPTEVWYNGHPGLTNSDMERNSRIRQGIENISMTDRELREWVALL